MLVVTQSAVENIKEYLGKNNIDSAIRVVLQSGCSGVGLGLALDEKKDADKVFEEGGITFLVEEGIFASTGTITVDFVTATSGCGCGGGGFAVRSEKPLGGGGCGGSCSSGSCGC